MRRPPQSSVLALDIGSSSVRSALFAANGKRIAASAANEQYFIRYTSDDGAELDPVVLLQGTRRCVAKTLRSQKGARLLAVAASGFWHGLLGLDRRNRAITPIFMWADSRSAPDAARLRGELSERRIQQRTGCMLRAPFWPAKLRWLKRTCPAIFKRVARWVSPPAWIFEQFFGVAATSHSMASGTGLYDFGKRTWDAELCALCGVRVEQLGSLGDRASLRDRVVFPAIGDGAAGNLGSDADRPGVLAINVGTSAAVRALLPRDSPRRRRLPLGLFRYVMADERTVIGGAISNGGNLHQWCLRELRVADEREAEQALSRRAAAAENSLTILPFLVQERSPTWPEGVRGTIAGLSALSSAPEILLAATTSVFYRLAAILEQLEAATEPAREVIVSGGILHSPASLCLLADCLGHDIRISREVESSLRGAAIHALRELGRPVPPLPRGRLIKHRADLAAKHRLRRQRQEDLERDALSSRVYREH